MSKERADTKVGRYRSLQVLILKLKDIGRVRTTGHDGTEDQKLRVGLQRFMSGKSAREVRQGRTGKAELWIKGTKWLRSDMIVVQRVGQQGGWDRMGLRTDAENYV